MIAHLDIIDGEFMRLIRTSKIKFGGNVRLRIYGTLTCSSGKRMKKQNRVFFSSEKEAKTLGFRPCGHCLRVKYRQWIEQESG